MNKILLHIHIPKTGGVSIQNTAKKNNIKLIFFEHKKFNEIRGNVKDYMTRGIVNVDNLDNYFTFAFVRNPYDRFLSSYCFYRDKKAGTQHVRNEIKKFKTFKDFCKNFDEFKYKDNIHFHKQIEFIVRDNKLNTIDFIGKFEYLDEGWKRICEINGLNNKIKLLHNNKTIHEPWKNEYDDIMSESIYNRYVDDFNTFNYEK